MKSKLDILVNQMYRFLLWLSIVFLWVSICLAIGMATSGCNGYYGKQIQGKIEVCDPNGKVVTVYKIETSQPMKLNIERDDVTIASDSRVKGLVESLTMDLGLHKSTSTGSYPDPYGIYGE